MWLLLSGHASLLRLHALFEVSYSLSQLVLLVLFLAVQHLCVMLRTLQLLSNDRSYANDDTIDKHIAEACSRLPNL